METAATDADRGIVALAARGEQLGLTEDEIRFYDALAHNESAVRELSDETLKKIARELAENLRQNLTVDWSQRESVQAEALGEARDQGKPVLVRLLPQLRDDVGVEHDHADSKLDVTEFDAHPRDLDDLVSDDLKACRAPGAC